MPGKNRYTLGANRTSALVDLTLPSGATCQARRPGVQGLISAGVLDGFDQLTALVQTEHIDRQEAAKSSRPKASDKVTEADATQAALALIADKEKLHAGILLIDKLVVYVVTQPALWIDYQMKDESDADFAKRQSEALANDSFAVREVDLDDKMFLINWAVGGSAELASFRKGTKKIVDNVAAEQAVSLPTKRASRTRRAANSVLL